MILQELSLTTAIVDEQRTALREVYHRLLDKLEEVFAVYRNGFNICGPCTEHVRQDWRDTTIQKRIDESWALIVPYAVAERFSVNHILEHLGTHVPEYYGQPR